jgi:hypothetical protein
LYIKGKYGLDWGKTFSPYINYWERLAVGKHPHLKMGKWGRLLSKAPPFKNGGAKEITPNFLKKKGTCQESTPI